MPDPITPDASAVAASAAPVPPTTPASEDAPDGFVWLRFRGFNPQGKRVHENAFYSGFGEWTPGSVRLIREEDVDFFLRAVNSDDWQCFEVVAGTTAAEVRAAEALADTADLTSITQGA